MGRKNDVLILSVIDPTRAYSCIKYLCQYLHDKHVDVECWSNVSENNIKEYHKWPIKTHSYIESIFGKIPKVRTIYKRFVGFLYAYAYRNRTIICHDLFHYQSCRKIKRRYPNTKLILYFTEIYNEKHSPLVQSLQRKFLKSPNDMDYMIECDYFREEYRREKNGVTKPSGTILNTIPMTELAESIRIPRHKNDVPIIVYSGGIHLPGEFDIIINALKDIPDDFIMEFYCFGNQDAIKQLNIECEKKIRGKYRIITNQPRKNVYAAIRNADIGIVYYDPEYSINTLYAAPTKFYEYVGLNVPVVCSANESLMYIIEKYNLGEIMPQNSSAGMKSAIEKLIRDDKYRERISASEKKTFETILCYEKQSEDALSSILKIIEGDRT